MNICSGTAEHWTRVPLGNLPHAEGFVWKTGRWEMLRRATVSFRSKSSFATQQRPLWKERQRRQQQGNGACLSLEDNVYAAELEK